MKKYLGLTAVICALVSATCGLADAPLRLASDGRTEYAIVKPDRPFPDDPAAVADLAHYLKRITGAEFPVISSDEIGKRPGVSRPFPQRRARYSPQLPTTRQPLTSM